jgi:hypothetical protein
MFLLELIFDVFHFRMECRLEQSFGFSAATAFPALLSSLGEAQCQYQQQLHQPASSSASSSSASASSSSSSSSSRFVRFASPQRLTHGSPVIFHSPHRRRSGTDEDNEVDDDSVTFESAASASSVHSMAAFGGSIKSALSTTANASKAATKHDSIRTEMGDWFSTEDIRSAMHSYLHSSLSSSSSASSSSSSSFRTLRLPVRSLMPSATAAAQTHKTTRNRTHNQNIADGGDSDDGHDGSDDAFSIPTFTTNSAAAAASSNVFNVTSASSSSSSSSHAGILRHPWPSILPLLPSWHSVPSSTLQTMLQRAIPIQWKLSRVGDVQQAV